MKDSPTDRAEPRGARRATSGFTSWVLGAVWLGLVVGLVELGVFLGKAHFLQAGMYRKSPHVLWMIPAADAFLLGVLSIGLALLIRPIRKVGPPIAALGLGTVALTMILLAVPGFRSGDCFLLGLGVASWLVPMVRARSEGARRLVRRSTPFLSLAMAGLVAFPVARDLIHERVSAPDRPAPEGAPNVLLIVLDTVRADDTSLVEPGKGTTPRLAELARRGARFDRAIATAPWTLPSHASLLTGRWAWELGVGPERPLDDRFPTLAEYLGRHGYETAGFVANTSFCTREFGLGRGFGHYEDYPISAADVLRSSALGWLVVRKSSGLLDRACEALGREANHPLEGNFTRKDADWINRDALAWITQPRDRPFFAFLNYFDAHDPYLLPDPSMRGSGRGRQSLAERKVLRGWVTEIQRERPDAHFDVAREAYLDCLTYLDDRVGRLVADLDRRGLLDNTIVIVTADHGEHFGEHERDGLPLVGHRLSLHQAEIHVPLLIVAPERMPTDVVVPRAVSLRDVPVTVVDLAGLREGSPFPGHSLVATLHGDPPATGTETASAAVSEFDPHIGLPAPLRPGLGSVGRMTAVVEDESSLIRHEDGRQQLFDLRDDPAESEDLSSNPESRDILERLREILDRLTPNGLGG